MNRKDLTLAQKTTYYAIKKFINENGFSPTVREIMELEEKNSPATIQTKIEILKDKGYITYQKGKQRTIRLVKGE